MTAVVMFAPAAGKARAAQAPGSPVLRTAGRVTLVEGILAVAVLSDLLLNAAADWWWAGPAGGTCWPATPRGKYGRSSFSPGLDRRAAHRAQHAERRSRSLAAVSWPLTRDQRRCSRSIGESHAGRDAARRRP
jgi:hypothetical protein